MIDATDTITELDLELETATDESDCEISTTDDEDTSVAYDDHLTEGLLARVRGYVPRHVQHAAEATEGYCEVLTERPDLIDGMIVDRVGATLIEADLADQAQTLQGTLDSAFIGADQLLELSYRYLDQDEEPGFLYTLTVDGRYLKSFRSSALAHVCFQVAVDRKVEDLPRLIARVIAYYVRCAANRGQDQHDTCTESFLEEVAHFTC